MAPVVVTVLHFSGLSCVVTLWCRPALHIYSWVQTALRGLVTPQDTLTQPLFHYIQAFKQKDLAEVGPTSSAPALPISHA